jgi:hypothetical protein
MIQFHAGLGHYIDVYYMETTPRTRPAVCYMVRNSDGSRKSQYSPSFMFQTQYESLRNASIGKVDENSAQWQCFDDDGNWCASGSIWRTKDRVGGETDFRPLDWYAMPEFGATVIQYKNKTTGKWETLW